MTYTITLKEFEGALDVLLGLIEARKLSINEVSLGDVTEEYFAYLEALKESNREYHGEIAAFLVIAATLMLIKSRSLLPGFAISKEEEADIRELEERLRTYKYVKEFTRQLGEHTHTRRRLFTRNAFVTVRPEFLPPKEDLELAKMLELLQELLRTLPKQEEFPEKQIKKIISLEERIRELETRIRDGAAKTFHELIKNSKERADVVVSFLALLELIKLGTIAAEQKEAFQTIHIENPSS